MSLVKDVQGLVTHYSEEVKQKGKHLDQVRVAGKITSIYSPILSDKQNDFSLLTNYLLTIDDEIGELSVYVSPLMFHHYQDILRVGNVVLFEGYVNVLSREIKGVIHKECSVVAYQAECLRGDPDA